MFDVHLFALPDWFNHLVAVVVFAAAFWRGDGRARILASTILGAGIAYHLFVKFGGPLRWDLTGVLGANLAYDVLVLAVCLVCARRAEAYWVVWACSVQLISVFTDGMQLVIGGFTLWAYASATIIWYHALNGVVLWGALSGPSRQTPTAQPAR